MACLRDAVRKWPWSVGLKGSTSLAKVQLVIFDCDGVLVDSEHIANLEFSKALQAQGLTLTVEQTMAQFMGRSMKSCMQMVEAQLGRRLPENFLSALDAATFAAFEAQLEAVPGVYALLDQLDAQGLAYCVASSGSHEKMRCSLGKTGLYARFKGRIYSSSEVARGKPFPDLFEYAAAQMQVAATHCLVVEDSVPGVQAALAAQMPVAGHASLRYQGSYARLEAAGAQVFTTMAQLAQRLA
jgi:HAD superfamily hydrolase (TIGR01509 family)